MKVIKEANWEPSLYWKAMPTEFDEDSPYYPVDHDGATVNISESDFHRMAEWEEI